MILNNFVYRLGDWLKQNRANVIKWLLIVAALFALLWTVFYVIENVQRWRYEKKVEALESQFQKKDAEAKEHQARADALEVEIAARDAHITALEKRSAAAKVVHEKTRTVYLSQKEEYENARYDPLPIANASCADLRAELADLGLVGR